MARIVHFEIQGRDPDALAAFYGTLLGWTFKRFGEHAYWLVDTGDASRPGINGGLLPRNGPPPQDGQGVNAFVCTAEVDDLDATLATAQRLGAAVAVPRMPIPGVGWLAYVKDPDGNLLGLMQPDTRAA